MFEAQQNWTIQMHNDNAFNQALLQQIKHRFKHLIPQNLPIYYQNPQDIIEKTGRGLYVKCTPNEYLFLYHKGTGPQFRHVIKSIFDTTEEAQRLNNTGIYNTIHAIYTLTELSGKFIVKHGIIPPANPVDKENYSKKQVTRINGILSHEAAIDEATQALYMIDIAYKYNNKLGKNALSPDQFVSLISQVFCIPISILSSSELSSCIQKVIQDAPIENEDHRKKYSTYYKSKDGTPVVYTSHTPNTQRIGGKLYEIIMSSIALDSQQIEHEIQQLALQIVTSFIHSFVFYSQFHDSKSSHIDNYYYLEGVSIVESSISYNIPLTTICDLSDLSLESAFKDRSTLETKLVYSLCRLINSCNIKIFSGEYGPLTKLQLDICKRETEITSRLQSLLLYVLIMYSVSDSLYVYIHEYDDKIDQFQQKHGEDILTPIIQIIIDKWERIHSYGS